MLVLVLVSLNPGQELYEPPRAVTLVAKVGTVECDEHSLSMSGVLQETSEDCVI